MNITEENLAPKSLIKTETIQGRKKFNVIDLTKAISTGKTAKKKEIKVKTKYKSTKTKEDNYIEPTITTQHINAQDNSVQDYINGCHPDIQTYIRINEPKSYLVKAGGLLIVCKNDLRIDINNLGNGRKVKITDRKRNILFDGITKLIVERKPSYAAN